MTIKSAWKFVNRQLQALNCPCFDSIPCHIRILYNNTLYRIQTSSQAVKTKNNSRFHICKQMRICRSLHTFIT